MRYRIADQRVTTYHAKALTPGRSTCVDEAGRAPKCLKRGRARARFHDSVTMTRVRLSVRFRHPVSPAPVYQES